MPYIVHILGIMQIFSKIISFIVLYYMPIYRRKEFIAIESNIYINYPVRFVYLIKKI